MSKSQFETRLSRREALRLMAVAAGTGVAWHFAGTTALAQIGIEQIPHQGYVDMPLLTREGSPAIELRRELGSGLRNAAPRIAFDSSGKLWAVAVEAEGRIERVVLRPFDGARWGDPVVLHDGPGEILHPALCAHGEGLALAFAQRRGWKSWFVNLIQLDGAGAIIGRRLFNASGQGGGIAWKPAITSHDGRILLAWEEKSVQERHFRVRLASIRQIDNVAVEFRDPPPAPDHDQFRPSLAASPTGGAWLVWDQTDAPGGSSIHLMGPVGIGGQATHRVTHHHAFNHAPAVAIDGANRVWVAWHTNRRGDDQWDIPRWYHLRCFDPTDGSWHEPAAEPPGKDLEKTGTDQGFEFPRLTSAPGGGILVTGRPSHNFCLQLLGAGGWSPLYRLPEDSWGGRGQFLAAAFDKDGALYVIRRDIRANILHKITGLPVEEGDLSLRRIDMEENARRAVPLVNIQRAAKPWEPLEELAGIDTPLHFYYGDLHGHTWMSDGTGDIDEYYRIRRDYYEDHFASLTDHDTFVGKSILPGEFEQMNEMTEHYNKPGSFATLFGQEYTTGRVPAGIGHKCIYATTPIPLLDHTESEQDTGAKLAARCRELDAMMVPHHVGWTGTDWENHDPIVQPLLEIVSNHGVMEYQGNMPIPHRGGLRGYFVQDALAMGHRFGLIGGSDNHGLIWHHKMAFRRDSYRTGLACVLAPELTRAAIFDAMRKRRTFATTGIKPRLEFRVNNHLMGEEIDIAAGEPVVISAQVIARERLVWLEVVKDNETWYQYGGEGYISRFTIRDTDPGPGTHWYYLRVIFEGNDMAWSSPVWVTVG